MIPGLRSSLRVLRIGIEVVRLVLLTGGFRRSNRGPQTLRSILRLGGAFVKFGQWISVRPDFAPPDIAASLEVLLDDMPPLPTRTIERVLESEFGQPPASLFSEFDSIPLSTASVAQVHRAVLAFSGEVVAVKVRRPGIKRRFQLDLRALRFFLEVMSLFDRRSSTLRVDELLNVFRETLAKEVDFLHEARNQERARRVIGRDPGVRIPRVFVELSTEKVLVMEFLDGLKLRDSLQFDEMGIDPRRIAEILATSFFHQFFRFGYYQADPHPGNFVFLRDNTVGFLDFGIVGHFDDKLVSILMNWIRALVEQDLRRLTRALFQVATCRGPVDEVALRTDLCEYMRLFEDPSSPLYSHRQVFAVFSRLVERHRISIPSFVLFFNRTLATLDGVSRKLAPDFDWQRHWRRLFIEEARRRTSPSRLKRELIAETLQARDLLSALPLRLNRILDSVEDSLSALPSRNRSEAPSVIFGLLGFLLLAVALFAIGNLVRLFSPELYSQVLDSPEISFTLLPVVLLFLLALVLAGWILGSRSRRRR